VKQALQDDRGDVTPPCQVFTKTGEGVAGAEWNRPPTGQERAQRAPSTSAGGLTRADETDGGRALARLESKAEAPVEDDEASASPDLFDQLAERHFFNSTDVHSSHPRVDTFR
jgi:hypothetical protein